MRIWAATDPTRTRPVGPSTDDWFHYIMFANVMPAAVTPTAVADMAGMVDSAHPRPFGQWLDSSEPPLLTELDQHLTTLFPPVRPRGYLELRMLDALPTVGRAAAIATVWALMVEDSVGEMAAEICRALGDPWRLANDEGLKNACLSAATARVLDLVARSSEPQLADSVMAWNETSSREAYRIDALIASAEVVD